VCWPAAWTGSRCCPTGRSSSRPLRLEFADGARVEVTSVGLRAAPPLITVGPGPRRGPSTGSYYFRTHMRLRTGHAAWAHSTPALHRARGEGPRRGADRGVPDPVAFLLDRGGGGDLRARYSAQLPWKPKGTRRGSSAVAIGPWRCPAPRRPAGPSGSPPRARPPRSASRRPRRVGRARHEHRLGGQRRRRSARRPGACPSAGRGGRWRLLDRAARPGSAAYQPWRCLRVSTAGRRAGTRRPGRPAGSPDRVGVLVQVEGPAHQPAPRPSRRRCRRRWGTAGATL
jgi:hypothetical protein